MGKPKTASGNNGQKVTFGRKKRGKAEKLRNKHDRKERKYRGQGK